MPPAPKPFVFTLAPEEVAEISVPSGEGGHQGFHEMIRDQLNQTGNTVTLNDAQFGQLVRYMTQYGSGGFQSRLRRAFSRSIRELFEL
jgi:hypothetical protein